MDDTYGEDTTRSYGKQLATELIATSAIPNQTVNLAYLKMPKVLFAPVTCSNMTTITPPLEADTFGDMMNHSIINLSQRQNLHTPLFFPLQTFSPIPNSTILIRTSTIPTTTSPIFTYIFINSTTIPSVRTTNINYHFSTNILTKIFIFEF